MTFLALTGFQAALLALVTAGAIVALYFLKLRHRRVVVASSLLWSRVLDERQAHSLWEKLRRLISIILAVLSDLLIALAVARPEIHWLTGGGERTLVVLDTSPSMLARTSDGQTRWQHAVDAALRTGQCERSQFGISRCRHSRTCGLRASHRSAGNSRSDRADEADRGNCRSSRKWMRKPFMSASLPTESFPFPLPAGLSVNLVFEEAENVGDHGV